MWSWTKAKALSLIGWDKGVSVSDHGDFSFDTKDIDSDPEMTLFVKQQVQQEKENAQKISLKKIKVGDNEVEFQVVIYKGKELAQLPVKDQFETDGGGGASCGYQTLKNGFETVLALSGKDVPNFLKDYVLDEQWIEQRNQHLKVTFKDPGLIKQLFGECGSWRRAVLYERTLTRLRTELSKDWKKALRNVKQLPFMDEQRVRNFYGNVVHSNSLHKRYLMESCRMSH